jgi:hypothetical protein
MNNFLVALAVAAFGFFLQYERLLALGGINPNLILIFLLLFAFTLKETVYFLFFSAFLFAITVLWGYFWIGEVILIFGLAFTARFLKNNFTGNMLLDFLLSTAVGTIVFYGIIALFSPTPFPNFILLFLETVYNILTGLFFWLIFSHFFRGIKLKLSGI